MNEREGCGRCRENGSATDDHRRRSMGSRTVIPIDTGRRDDIERAVGGFTESADRIRAACSDLAEFLVEKNRSYGDSALKPVGIFARGNPEDLIRVRLDDKINRIRNNPEAFGEDAVRDLAGYLILLMVARDVQAEAAPADGDATDTPNMKEH